jgi:ribosomal protein L16 Arg81 hydroxylase
LQAPASDSRIGIQFRNGEERFCDFEVRDGRTNPVTAEEFEREYRNRRPVVLRYGEDPPWVNRDQWTRKQLLNKLGTKNVEMGRSWGIVRTRGSGEVQVDLEQFLNELMDERDDADEPWYIFSRSLLKARGGVKPHIPSELTGVSTDELDPFFLLGSSSSGTSFHNHAEAWTGAVFGRKRWFLYPVETTPAGGHWPGYGQLDWYNQLYSSLEGGRRPVECMQLPGDLMYLPDGWYHGVINIDDSLGLSLQNIKANPANVPMTTVYALRTERNLEVRLEMWKKFTELLPTSAEGHHQYAVVLRQAKQLDKAMHHYLRSLELEPAFIYSLTELASMYEQKGEQNNALRVLKRAQQLCPRNGDIRRDLYSLHMKRLSKAHTARVDDFGPAIAHLAKVARVTTMRSREWAYENLYQTFKKAGLKIPQPQQFNIW